jgi:hypothetical protein
MEGNTLYYQNITGESSMGSEFSDPLFIGDFSDFSFSERGEDSWVLGAPGKPGDVGGDFPPGSAPISDSLTSFLFLVVVYVVVLRIRGVLSKSKKKCNPVNKINRV